MNKISKFKKLKVNKSLNKMNKTQNLLKHNTNVENLFKHKRRNNEFEPL